MLPARVYKTKLAKVIFFYTLRSRSKKKRRKKLAFNGTNEYKY